jgi:hypothetical protein
MIPAYRRTHWYSTFFDNIVEKPAQGQHSTGKFGARALLAAPSGRSGETFWGLRTFSITSLGSRIEVHLPIVGSGGGGIMQGRVFHVEETPPAADPYRAGRYGFWFTFACPAGRIDSPIATALRRLPPRDWLYDARTGTWWVAEEHLPVLRRLFANFDDCISLPGRAVSA